VLLEIGTYRTYPEQRLVEQIVADMTLAQAAFGRLPDAIALLLHPKETYRVPDHCTIRGRLGWASLEARWRVVELWNVPAGALLAAGQVGLIPWVPLTKYIETPRSMLQRCRLAIDQHAVGAERANLLAVTQCWPRCGIMTRGC
jgi:hypothetical protein